MHIYIDNNVNYFIFIYLPRTKPLAAPLYILAYRLSVNRVGAVPHLMGAVTTLTVFLNVDFFLFATFLVDGLGTGPGTAFCPGVWNLDKLVPFSYTISRLHTECNSNAVLAPDVLP